MSCQCETVIPRKWREQKKSEEKKQARTHRDIGLGFRKKMRWIGHPKKSVEYDKGL